MSLKSGFGSLGTELLHFLLCIPAELGRRCWGLTAATQVSSSPSTPSPLLQVPRSLTAPGSRSRSCKCGSGEQQQWDWEANGRRKIPVFTACPMQSSRWIDRNVPDLSRCIWCCFRETKMGFGFSWCCLGLQKELLSDGGYCFANKLLCLLVVLLFGIKIYESTKVFYWASWVGLSQVH